MVIAKPIFFNFENIIFTPPSFSQFLVLDSAKTMPIKITFTNKQNPRIYYRINDKKLQKYTKLYKYFQKTLFLS
jgi:hypothetical protein